MLLNYSEYTVQCQGRTAGLGRRRSENSWILYRLMLLPEKPMYRYFKYHKSDLTHLFFERYIYVLNEDLS